MKRRRHEYKTLWATFWELAIFTLKATAVILLIVGWAFIFYRGRNGN